MSLITINKVNVYKFGKPCKPKRKRTLTWIFEFDNITIKNVNTMAGLKLQVGQKFKGTLAPKKKDGSPATVETGKTKFTSSDDSIVTLTQDANDELTVHGEVIATGTVTITGEVDADKGEGVKTLTATADIEAVEEEAATLEFGVAEETAPAQGE